MPMLANKFSQKKKADFGGILPKGRKIPALFIEFRSQHDVEF